MKVPAYGIWDSETRDFILIDGMIRLYWKEEAAERMLVAIGDPRYSVVKTQITRRGEEDEEE